MGKDGVGANVSEIGEIALGAKDNQFLNSEEVYGIYRDNGAFIRDVIAYHLGNSPDSEDIFQSFFLRLLEKPVPQKEVIKQRSYLHQMIVHDIIDTTRMTGTYKKYVFKYSGILPRNEDFYNPFEKAAQKDDVNFIMRLINNYLPSYIRIPLRLYYKENYSSSQIAKEISIKKKSVIKYISTGLKMLRKISEKN